MIKKAQVPKMKTTSIMPAPYAPYVPQIIKPEPVLFPSEGKKAIAKCSNILAHNEMRQERRTD
jgi:hypothetical protein